MRQSVSARYIQGESGLLQRLFCLGVITLCLSGGCVANVNDLPEGDEASSLSYPVEGEYRITSLIDTSLVLRLTVESMLDAFQDLSSESPRVNQVLHELRFLLAKLPDSLAGGPASELLEDAFGEEAVVYSDVIDWISGNELNYSMTSELTIISTEFAWRGRESFQYMSANMPSGRYRLASAELPTSIDSETYAVRSRDGKVQLGEHEITVPYGSFIDFVVKEATRAAGLEEMDAKSLLLSLISCTHVGQRLGAGAVDLCMNVKPRILDAVGKAIENQSLVAKTSAMADRASGDETFVLTGVRDAGSLKIPFRAVLRQAE